MQQSRSNHLSVEEATRLALQNRQASWPVTLATVFVPVAVAFGIEFFNWAGDVRWSLFYIAVFFSSWLGGFVSGLGATILSATLVWWFFTWPRYHFVKTDARHYLAAIAFIAIGYLISALHQRLRTRTRELALALLDARALSARLQGAVDERRLFGALIENCSDFISIADPDGKPVYVNPAGRRMIELPPEFALDTIRRADFYPLGLQPVPDLIAKELFEAGRWRGETRLRNWRTGESIPVSDTQFLIRDQETDRLLGIGTIARDMSLAQRHRRELEATNHRLSEALLDLESSRRYLQGILDHSPNGIVIKSLDGRYLVINKGFELLTGVSAANAAGKTDFHLFPQEIAERFRANDKTVLTTRTSLVTEERTGRTDGRVMLVSKFPLLDEHNGVFAICAIWVDLTEHKRNEESLRQNATDLRTAQRVARVGSWHWDRHTDKTQWSEELFEIFGQDPRKPPPPFLAPQTKIYTAESEAQLRAAAKKLLETGVPYELDLEVVRPDGGRRWVSAHGAPVRDAQGNIIGIDGTAADVSHVKALQRMRDEWTSVIAHDLRQPIGVIAMASNFLPTLHGGKLTADEREFMKRIQSATNTLARMVDDLLDMSLLEANRLKLERKWVDPEAVIREAVDRTMQTAGTKQVRVSSPRDLPQVYADPMRIEQVLGNLLSNAVKYGENDHDILVRIDQTDGGIEVSVTNHGKGIDPGELPRLFDRFARSRATRGTGVPGLGLGLYISKGVIEAHGGRLWAESVPGQTTAFHFSLPIAAATREAA